MGGFDGLITTPPVVPSAAADELSQSTQSKLAEMEQQNEHQKQIIDRLLMEQQQITSTKDNLQRIVVNQLNQISKFGQQYDEQELLCIALRNNNEEIMQKYGQLEAAHARICKEHEELKGQYNALRQVEDEKEREADPLKIMNTEETVEWIVGLDKQRYGKYYDVLMDNMQKEGIDEDCLPDLCKDDLYRLGVVQFKDKRDIMKSIRQFVKSKNKMVK